MTMTPETDPSQPHHFQIRVYYEDTDAEAIVYYANYLKFAERARTEFLRTLGYSHHQIRSEYNLGFVARHVEADYLASARLDDLLDIQTEVVDMRTASMTMKQVIRCQDKVLSDVTIVLVAVNPSGKAVRIPPQLRQIFGR